MRNRNHGIGLALTLPLLTLVTIVVFAGAAVAVGSLRAASAYRDSTKALYAAEAGVQRALDDLAANPLTSSISSSSVSGSSDATYQVQITNNLSGSGPVAGLRTASVPAGCCEIVATGRANSLQRSVVVLAMGGWSGWDYALASDSELHVNPQPKVVGASTLDVALKALANPTTESDLPGSVYGKGEIELKNVYVSGRVKSPKQKSVSGTVVQGLTNGSTPLPVIAPTLPTYDPADPQVQVLTSPSGDLSLDGNAGIKTYVINSPVTLNSLRVNGVRVIVNGNLKTSHGLFNSQGEIWATGTLSVGGGLHASTDPTLSATGALLALGAGTSSLKGVSTFDPTNATGMLLYSRGDLHVDDSIEFQGIIYTDGQYHAEVPNGSSSGSAKIIGSVIARGELHVEQDKSVFVFTPAYNPLLNQWATGGGGGRLSITSWNQ